MTIYTTDFSEYTAGVALPDWTDYWVAGNFTYLAQVNSGDFKVGTKECNYIATSTARSVLTWDDIGSVADSDIIAKINANSFVGTGIRLYSRVSGSSSSENAYFVMFTEAAFSLHKYVSGVSGSLPTKNFIPKANTNYWIRFQTVGETIRAKIWAEDAIEPAEWKLSTTDPDHASGNCGFGSYVTVDYEVDYFSCGTGTDSAVFPPSGWDLSDKFGYVGDTETEDYVSVTRALGGLFELENRILTGVRLYCHDHADDVRVGVYSGGDLLTGLNNAMLLYDFGKTSGIATGYIELSCPPIDIPQNEPLWIAVKGDNPSGFGYTFANDSGNSGNFQVARGRCDINSIIGNDPDVVFPTTFPNSSGTFANFWYDWNILFTNKVSTPIIFPVSGTYPASQLISMSTETSGASIYYTTDGSIPDSGDNLYSVPFALTSAKTIKAIGILSGFNDSDIASETYTISTGSLNKLYLNGKLIHSELSTANDITADSGGGFLGQLQSSLGGGFNVNNSLDGLLSKIRLYRSGITQNKVTSLFNEFKVAPIGLVTHYPMDYPITNGTLIPDNESSYNGTIVGGITFAPGIISNCIELDGTSGFINLDGFSAEVGVSTTMLGLSFFFNAPTAPISLGIIFSLHNSSGANLLHIGINSTGAIYIWTPDIISPVLIDAGNITDGNWNHAVVIFYENNCHLYVNKQIYNISKIAGFGSIMSTVAKVTIGADYDPGIIPDDFYEGKIDDFKIFVDTNINAGNAAYLYETGFPIPGAVENRLNTKLNIKARSVRDTYDSYNDYDFNLNRSGHGYNYGNFYGG